METVARCPGDDIELEIKILNTDTNICLITVRLQY